MLYLIISNVALLLFFGIYWFGTRKLTFFHWNRYYLICSLLTAYVIPLGLYLKLPKSELMHFKLPEIIVGLSPVLATSNAQSAELTDMFSLPSWSTIYWIGVCLFAIWLIIRLFRLLELIQHGNGKQSFSFFGKIIINKELRDDEYNQVYLHEEEHRKQGHSFDIMLVELFRVFNWFNPVYQLLIKELKFLHECIVDEKHAENKVSYAELLLAQAMDTQRTVLQHEFSNHSLLKNRIMMLFKEKTDYKFKVTYLLAIPTSLLVLMLVVNCRQTEKETKTVETEVAKPKTEEIVLEDAPDNEPFQGELVEKAEILAEYPGGFNNFRSFVQENYTFPQAAIDAGVKGKVEASFIIGSDGKISNIKIIEDLKHGTGEALIAAIKKAEDWKPAIRNGQKVATKYTIPLRLDLTPM